jgi:hypothetical protein
MSLKSLAAAIALFTSASTAFADITPTFDGLSAGFTVSHSAAFTDTLTFSLPGITSVEVSIFSVGLGAHNIDFISATLNGVALKVTNGMVDTIDTPTALALTGPLKLVISGMSGSNASYFGTLIVTTVPEPESVALVLAGMGVMGVMARRRGPR